MLDFETLEAHAGQLRPMFRQSRPVPYLRLRQLFSTAAFEEICCAASQMDLAMTASSRSLPAVLRELFWELNSGSSMRLLRELTGVGSLIPDPLVVGGGICWRSVGEAEPVVAKTHPKNGLPICLSMHVCLNREWAVESGGGLDFGGGQIELPKPGQALLFLSSSDAIVPQQSVVGEQPLKELKIHYYHRRVVRIGDQSQ